MTNDKLKPYVDQLEEMSRGRDDITDAEKDLLARVRNHLDRQRISYTRLVRTFYSDDSDTRFADLLSQSEFDEPVFDNAALYDAGADNGLLSLHNILIRIPQIVEMTAWHVLHCDEQTQEALQEAMRVGLDEIGYAVAMYHLASKWSHVLIYDKEANDTSKVLLVYLDDRGRVLRYSRLWNFEELQDASAMLWTGQDTMNRWWEGGQYGEDWEPQHLARQIEAQQPWRNRLRRTQARVQSSKTQNARAV
ncbi:uncharacterized protein N7483_001293 [Penicillium malachiteum]|uniref:uncharacterized protein n=1 Tax=Penicillium malachiteum TaxID=1324776 RepID=UPI00254891F2|nr:uncharacterized protein N7483_001293 [Penicillium malachiteum]KAJ5736168.1 hypothetical protein N7483_001293 [Penicillium malachiteum]